MRGFSVSDQSRAFIQKKDSPTEPLPDEVILFCYNMLSLLSFFFYLPWEGVSALPDDI